MTWIGPRPTKWFIGVVSATIVAGAMAAAAAPQAQAPACTAAEHRQFDFWVGDWAVFDTRTGARAGSSRIERLYGGCAIRENWSEPGFSGGSLNAFFAADRKWHQTWTDASGAWREFVGGWEDGRMVLVWTHPSASRPGETARRRLTYTPGPVGSVRQQAAEQIGDGPWVERYDLTYRRRHLAS
jgi:hypothetical protein